MVSEEAEQLQEALALYRQHENTERRDEMYRHLCDVVDAIKRGRSKRAER